MKKKQSEQPVQPISVKDYISVPTESNVEMVEDDSTVTDITPKTEKSFTLDVTSKTLQMLAEAVAKKISDDITNSDLSNKLIEAGGYKRDNEILAKQIQELLEHNKELSARIEQLESHPSRSFWKRFWSK